jgi:hypothetical protein
MNFERMYNEARGELESVLETLGAMNIEMDAAEEAKLVLDQHDEQLADAAARGKR